VSRKAEWVGSVNCLSRVGDSCNLQNAFLSLRVGGEICKSEAITRLVLEAKMLKSLRVDGTGALFYGHESSQKRV
jgi:hypothetical protein